MEKVKKFIRSLYLGDRYCEKVEIKDSMIMLQINCISRLEDGTEEWNYYSQKDIQHGYLVFDGVVDYYFSSKLTINDEIYEIQIKEKKDNIYSFIVYGCNISDMAVSEDVELYIRAKEFYIMNPKDNNIITE